MVHRESPSAADVAGLTAGWSRSRSRSAPQFLRLIGGRHLSPAANDAGEERGAWAGMAARHSRPRRPPQNGCYNCGGPT